MALPDRRVRPLPAACERGGSGEAAQGVISVVKNGRDLGVLHVGFVVIVETGVDDLGQLLTFERLHSCFHRLVADTHGVLGDRAGNGAVVDHVLLGFAGIKTDNDYTSFLGFFQALAGADRGAFIGAKMPLSLG